MDKETAVAAINSLADDFFAVQPVSTRAAGNRITEYNVLDTEDVGTLNKLLNKYAKEGWSLQGKIKDYNKAINSGATYHRFWAVMTRTVKLVEKKGTASADDILQAIRNRRASTSDIIAASDAAVVEIATNDMPANEGMRVIEELIDDVIAEEPKETALDRFVKNHTKPDKKNIKRTRPPFR